MRVIAALLAIALLQAPAALPPTRDQLFGLFGSYLNSLRIQAGVPGIAAAVMDNSGVVWQQAFGQMDVARSVATRTDTPFHLDGLTQIFVATLVLRCVEQGRLTLDTLIPNATYRIQTQTGVKDFAVEAGKTTDLGDVVDPVVYAESP